MCSLRLCSRVKKWKRNTLTCSFFFSQCWLHQGSSSSLIYPSTARKKKKKKLEKENSCMLFFPLTILVASKVIIISHLSLNREGRWGTTDDFTTSFPHFPLFFTALWDLANSRPVRSLMLSSHLFLSLSCLLPPSPDVILCD